MFEKLKQWFNNTTIKDIEKEIEKIEPNHTNIPVTSPIVPAPIVRAPKPVVDNRQQPGTMQLSHSGAALIKHFEGCILHTYDDGAGYDTIGWGHLIVPGDGFNHHSVITQDEADILFDKEIQPFEDAVNKLVKVRITQGEYDALVSFSYNVGIGALAHSTLLKDLNAGDYHSASLQFPQWDKAGGRVMIGLERRRKDEELEFDGGERLMVDIASMTSAERMAAFKTNAAGTVMENASSSSSTSTSSSSLGDTIHSNLVNAAGILGAATTGFNEGVEKVTQGALQLGSYLAPGGSNAVGVFQKTYEQDKLQELQQAKTNHPIAEAVGEGVGITAATLPFGQIGGAGAANLIDRTLTSTVQMGAAGFTQKADTLNDRLTNTLEWGAGGAVAQIGTEGGIAALQGLGTAAKWLGRGINTAFTSTNSVVRGAIDQATQKLGGDLSQATTSGILEDTDKLINGPIKTDSDTLYTARDKAADAAGLTVNRYALKAQVADLAAQQVKSDPGGTIGAVLKEAKSTLGDGSPQTFAEAQASLSKLNQTAFKLKQTDPMKSAAIMDVATALNKDINAAIPLGSDVMKLHNIATTNYAQVVSPLKVAQGKLMAMDTVNNDLFIAKAMKYIGTTPQGRQLMNTLPDEAQRNFSVSYLKALEAGSLNAKSQFDPQLMANQLQKEAIKNPALTKQIANIFSGLANVISAQGVGKKFWGNAALNIFSTIGAGTDAVATGGMATVAQLGYRTWYLMKAGYMMSKPETRELLDQYVSAQMKKAPEPILTAMSDRIVSAFKVAGNKDWEGIGKYWKTNASAGMSIKDVSGSGFGTKGFNSPATGADETWYHGTTKNISIPTTQGINKEISLTNNANFASVYGKPLNVKLSPNAKILDLTSTPGKNISNNELKKLGYDGVKYFDSSKPKAQKLLRLIKDGLLSK